MDRLGSYQLVIALALAVVDMGTIDVTEAGAQPPQGWRPLSLLGYNADVIADKDTTVRFSMAFDGNRSSPPAAGACGWFEAGARDVFATEHDNGLPAGAAFESATGSGVVYLMQPTVLDNVLQIGAGQRGTLTLLHPPYRQIDDPFFVRQCQRDCYWNLHNRLR